ncbi:hypothetical protein EST38_g7813 [Candolleomyces aberdarensis]|uniref:Uncharacterized protein n=1 Tax=Candolleomyces aberdarensis TaxID=2316362 RepID=A0A4Q2DE66_9AGAR|nr:hypothetical protein EST38_g7813 [Candolleomyces aberdarensis]
MLRLPPASCYRGRQLREEEAAARIAAERKKEAKKQEEAKSKAEAETEAAGNEQMDAEPTSTSPTAPPVEQQEVKAPATQPITEFQPPRNVSETAQRADQVMAEASNADTADAEMADAEDSNQEQPLIATDGSPEAPTSQEQPEASLLLLRQNESRS